ncbi:MAG: cation-translocating P-type ATPase [Polaromonas sp.]
MAAAPLDAPAAASGNRFTVFDDPEEWAVFSQPCSQPCSQTTLAGAGTGGLWESQVLVQGMHCAACALTLERTLLAVTGVVTARVSVAGQRASVIWSADLTRPSKWMAAPQAAGYVLLPAPDAFTPQEGRREARLALWRWLVAGFCMMQVMMYAFPAYITRPGDISPDIQSLLRWASWVLTLPVVLFSCGPFFQNALRDLRQRRIGMDLPVALGIAITFMVSTAATFEPQGWWGQEVYFDSLAMFVFFLLTGRWLEQGLRQRTAGALGSLMQRLPDSVERQSASGTFERVAARRLVPGDLIRVLPGEAFPADGQIVEGETLADEALLTGESRPVPRAAGASVMAGSHNLSAPVQVRVQCTGRATRYAQIVALMEQASLDKPRLALLADRIARPFLWFVLVAASGAAAFWWQTDPSRALMAAVAVLVVTCPCALSLATPTAMLTSAGWLARRGVLVRRLQALESLAHIDTVVFDKTGTLTEARMALASVTLRSGVTRADVLQRVSGLAAHSLHPVSRALVRAAAGDGLSPSWAAPEFTDVLEIPGSGIQGQQAAPSVARSGGLLRLGSARFCGVEQPPHGSTAGMAADGKETPETVMQVYLADDSGWLARFDLEERIRAGGPAAVVALRAAGVAVQMLSGDRLASARRVAGRLGITQVQGDCTPQDKLAHLQALQNKGHRVLMVGDGLNDGPVLARADVSVAIGDAAPLAQAHSDFVMPGGQLGMLPALLLQARRTMRVVRQNLWWAAGYNAVCVPLALTGTLPAWLAGLGMALSSLLVLGNAARLARAPRGL